jgi:hypothetical protein
VATLPGKPLRRTHARNRHSGHRALVGNVLERIIADAGNRGHNALTDHKFSVYTAGQSAASPSRSSASSSAGRHRANDRPSQRRPPHAPQLSRPLD